MAITKIRNPGIIENANASLIEIDDLQDVHSPSPSDAQVLTWDNGNAYWKPADASGGSGQGVTVYATINDLPLSGVDEGSMALVDSTDTLYIWSDNGWYKIALVNTTPSISNVESTYELSGTGADTVIDIVAEDPEGIPITFSIASDTSGDLATVTQGTGADTNVFTITPTSNTSLSGTFDLTFRASDGVNIGTAVATFSLAFKVENSNYTTALITAVGGNNVRNNSFVDSGPNTETITTAGEVEQIAFSPYRPGGYSTKFDGTGDSLSITGGSNFTMAGDFTAECWIYCTATTNDYAGILGFSHDGESAGWNILLRSNGKFHFNVGMTYSDATGSVTLNEWTHLALVRSGSGSGNCKLYVNGVADATTITKTGSVAQPSFIEIGGYPAISSRKFVGYISDVRVVNGTAVYTTNFTPPSDRLEAISNTKLLTCHKPYLKDESTVGATIAVNGDPTFEPFAPFDYQAYDAADFGASAKFDGSGDYLTSVSNGISNVGTGNFTFEGWFYLTADPSNYISIVASRASNASTTGFVMAISASDFYIYTGAHLVQKGSAIYKNQWYHWAYTRESGTHRLFLNGELIDSDSTSRDYTDDTFWIGAKYDGTEFFTGYQSDVRVVKGTAVYTSAFTPPTAPLSAVTNTTVLLPMDDGGIIDKSQSAKHVALYGDTKCSTTTSPISDYSSSIYFDGSGDYIRTEYQGLSNFGTLPFTIEGWFYLTVSPSNYITIVQSRNTSWSTSGWEVTISASDFYFDVNGSVAAKGSAISQNTWYHYAVSRTSAGSNNLKMFLDGTQIGSTATVTNDFTLDIFWIGAKYNAFEGGGDVVRNFTGYMSDIRLTKGYARYTSNFTRPSTPLG